MKRLLWIAPLILSMAEPIKDNIKVEVEDQAGVRHHFNGLACGGRNYLKVKEGNVEYSVDFNNLKSLEVLSSEKDRLKLKLYFKNGGVREFYAPANLYCKTKSSIGEAGFYLKDVKAIFIKKEDKKHEKI